HREEPGVAVAGQLVQRHQVAVGDVGDGAKLVLEAQQAAGADLLQRLQGDDVAALGVLRLEHHAHGARAQRLQELVTTEPAPWGRGAAWWRRAGRIGSERRWRFRHAPSYRLTPDLTSLAVRAGPR